MTVGDFVVLLVVAGVCGGIGRALTGYSHGGCLLSIGLGFVGAVIGMWLGRELRLPEFFTVHVGGTAFPIVSSILGAALFALVVSLLTRRRLP